MSRYFTSNMRPNNSNNRTNFKKKINMGYIVLIVAVVIFVIRAIGVINNYGERGGFAYVQLLNYSMPVVENQIYDESVYADNNLSVKRVVKEALGLNSITTYGIVGSEVTLLKNTKATKATKPTSFPFNFFSPYEVNEDSIAKLTEEDIAQLNAVSGAYDPSLKKTLDSSKPEVLIYSTHTHEAYSDTTNWSTLNEDFNVVGVGDILEKELQEGYGISVIHDKTVHDNSYNECYDRSSETVQNYINQYGDFKLIIDLHRDSAENRDTSVVNLNGENLAKLMFVTAGNSSRYDANQATVNSLLNIQSSLFPGLFKDTYHYPAGINGFNQGYSDGSVLLEFGTVANTAQEAKLSAKYMARIIAEYINKQQ